MGQIWQEVSPILSDLIVEVIKFAVVVLLAVFGIMKLKVKSAIDSIKDKNQRELFHKIANEAFAYAETVYKSETSRNKLNQAFMYASNKLGDLGISVTTEEITAAIEKACLEFNANKVKIVKEDKDS